MSISRIFDISRRSMATYQRAMDAATHNVVNSSNPDYSRQRVQFATERPEMLKGLVWGTGVKIETILRVRDDLTDSQLRVNTQKWADNNKRSQINGQMEVLFTEPSDAGISSLLDNFFNSWNELSVTPSSSALRYNVIRAAENLSTKIRDVYEGLDIIKSDVLNEAKANVAAVNSLLEEIQVLNAQIYESSSIGFEANDLLDKRDKKIDELSNLVNINISYDSSNSAIISIGGIFAADRANTAKFKISEQNGKLTMVSADTDLSANISGGELSAVMDIYSREIPAYLNNIDTLSRTLVDSVNAQHKSGFTITDPPETGINFFEGYSNGVIKINSAVLNDPRKISVSSDGTNGNGDIARNISELSFGKLVNGETLNENYSGMITEIGNRKLSADQLAESTHLVMQQLEKQKASYSGVSIDEEMTNIIKFQRSYEASAKMIQIADELLETVLSLV